MSIRSMVGLADLADALRWLAPQGSAVEHIAAALGFVAISDVRPEDGSATEPGVDPDAAPATGQDSGPSEEGSGGLPPGEGPWMEPGTDASGGETVSIRPLGNSRRPVGVPVKIRNAAPLPGGWSYSPPPARRIPLLPRHLARSFIWETLAEQLPGEEIDEEAAVEQLASGSIPTLRRVRRKGLRNGVQMLVDEGPAMQPFQADVRDLQAHIRSVVGSSWLGDLYFQRLPDRGVETELGVQLGHYRPPSPGTTVLLVTDLGIGRPRGSSHASRHEWGAFLRRLTNAGCRTIAILPYGRRRWPSIRGGTFRIAYWGTQKVSGASVPVRDLARILSAAAVLDEAIIRAARRKFFPSADAGAEADLLFSPFVAVHNARVISLRDEVLRELRDELARRPEDRDEALDFLSTYREASATTERILFEETLIAAVLTGKSREIDMSVASALRAVLVDEADPGLARWAASAVNGLPRAAASRRLLQQLRMASNLRLGIPPADFKELPAGDSWILPVDSDVGVSWKEGNLVLCDPPVPGGETIGVPATVPRHVLVETAAGRSTPVQIWPGRRPISVPAELPLELSALSGARYRVSTEGELPQTLRDRLRAGKVIPFVGGGVSMAVVSRRTGERLFPSWRELLLHAADRLELGHKPVPAGLVRSLMSMGRAKDYLSAAEEAREALGPSWFRFLKDQFDPPRAEAADESLALAQLVWRLNSNLVVTTSHDNVLRWAHPSGADLRVWSIQAVAEQAGLLRDGARHPTVWHLHGHIDDAAHLILSPGGHQLLYPSASDARARYEAALQTLRSLLTSQSFLFIGFSMDDEQLGRQLERMEEVLGGAGGPHYVLVREAERERVKSLGLPVEVVTFSDFGQPLLDALAALGEAANEAIASAVEDRPDYGGGDPAAPAPVFSIPFLPKGNDFIGRENALQAVRKQLAHGRRTQTGQAAALLGLGGLGKTQLAVEYAYRFRDEYPGGVIWLAADQDIDAQLTELATSAGWIAPESEHKYKLDVAMQRLRAHSGLLVLDDVESREVIESYLPAREAGAHTLLTSRTEQHGFVPVPLDLLDLEQSVELLTREAGREPESVAEQQALREVAQILGGLPLALELAGAFIRHRSIGWGLYRDRLTRNPRAALSGKFLQSSTDHESDLYSTLQVDEEVFQEEPLLRDVMDVLAWSGPAPMGVSLLSTLLALDAPVELTDALGLGIALRLLQKTPGADSYAIHRLVAEAWRESHPVHERREWVKATCSRLGGWFQDRRESVLDLPAFEAEIAHLRVWQEHADTEVPDESVRLLWLQAYPPYFRGRYGEAHGHVEKALSTLRTRATTAPRELLGHLLNDLGSTSRALGRHREALEYQQSALEIRLELFGERHSDTATSLDNFGSTLGSLGEYRNALEYQERALTIRQELFGERHADTAMSLDNIGNTYSKLGEYRKALEYQQRALVIRQELFGERHPHTAMSLDNVGSAYGSLVDRRRALEYQERALAIRQELFGERHPHTAMSLDNVGSAYGDLGEHRRALEYQERALTIRRELLGRSHPEVALSLVNVGSTYGELGEHPRALECKRQAVELDEQILGEVHPQTAAAVLSLSRTLLQLNQADEAFEMVLVLFRKLDPGYPSYAAVQQHLNELSTGMVRPGFRQPSPRKRSQNKKRKSEEG